LLSISEQPIDIEMLLEKIKDDGAGATVLFLGSVRNQSEGSTVSSIYYEAYVRMALETMSKIEAEAFERWNLKRFAAMLRVGELKVGQVSVAIGVSAEHRAEAFEAGQYAIDKVKAETPIWKKETAGDGNSFWAEGKVLGRG
jgi:molybdopterin synthase catalytic subunit